MKSYSVIDNLSHNGRGYVSGDTIELADGAVEALVKAGVIEAEPVADAAGADGSSPSGEKALSRMNLAEIKAVAEAEGVAFDDAATKAVIAAAIEAKRAELAAAAASA